MTAGLEESLQSVRPTYSGHYFVCSPSKCRPPHITLSDIALCRVCDLILVWHSRVQRLTLALHSGRSPFWHSFASPKFASQLSFPLPFRTAGKTEAQKGIESQLRLKALQQPDFFLFFSRLWLTSFAHGYRLFVVLSDVTLLFC